MTLQRIDHVGVVVNDLAATKAFFLGIRHIAFAVDDIEARRWPG